MKKLILLALVFALAGCNANREISISNTKPEAPAVKKSAAPLAKQRSEPIFYNGKTYQLDFGQNPSGQYNVAVNGMTAKQQKDAEAISTSALRYYACKDSQTSKLNGAPEYVGGQWKLLVGCV